MQTAAHPLSFTSGGFRLDGFLHLPAKKTAAAPPVVIGSHGLASDGNSAKQIALAEQLNTCGIAYFRFHHKGCGTSEGHFESVTTLPNRCEDLTAAIAYARSLPETGDRFALFGSSLGGATALSVFQDHPEAAAIVVIAPPIRSRMLTKAPEHENADAAVLTPAFYRKNLDFDISDRLPAIHHLLVFHGNADDIVPVDNGQETVKAATAPKQLVVFQGGDHRMSAAADQAVFLDTACAWYRRFLLPDELSK